MESMASRDPRCGIGITYSRLRQARVWRALLPPRRPEPAVSDGVDLTAGAPIGLVGSPAMRPGRICTCSCSRRPSTRKQEPGSSPSQAARSSGRTLPLRSNCPNATPAPAPRVFSVVVPETRNWSASLVVGLESKPISADSRTMALRIATRLPRLVIVGVVHPARKRDSCSRRGETADSRAQGAPAPVSAPTLVVPGPTVRTGIRLRQGHARGHRFCVARHGLGLLEQGCEPVAACQQRRRSSAPHRARKGGPGNISPSHAVQPIRLASTTVTPAAPVRCSQGRRAEGPRGGDASDHEDRAAPRSSAERSAACGCADVEGDAASATRQASQGVDRGALEDEGERQALPLPAQLDCHRRLRLVARAGRIAADRLARKRWGIGTKSELVASRTLAEVKARMDDRAGAQQAAHRGRGWLQLGGDAHCDGDHQHRLRGHHRHLP